MSRLAATPGPHADDPTARQAHVSPEPTPARVDTSMHSSTSRPGAAIGRYLVLEQAGTGGMARVFRAYDPRLHREVAIKLLRSVGNADDRARIVREARAMAQLSHPNVVAVYDVEEAGDGAEGSVLFVAMEFVQGCTLVRWLAGEHRVRDVLQVFAQVGRALAAAHAVGLVHRDVKPSNVLVGDDGRARVADFGLARTDLAVARSAPGDQRAASIDEVSSSDTDPSWDTAVTQVGTVVGTPAYMAPEQHEGEPADPAADQYAYAVTLWEALYHRRPFAAGTLEELAALKRRGPPPPPNGSVPRWIHATLARALDAAPSGRFHSMTAMLAALDADPAKHRRRWIGGALVLALAGAVWLGDRAVQATRRARCEAEGAAIEASWGERGRASASQGLAASGSPVASDTWSRVRPWLDDFAADWALARSEICVQAEVEGVVPDDARARAVECLDERRDAFAAVVESLAAADAGIVHRAVGAAAGLPAPASCRDALRPHGPAPPPESRVEVAALRQVLARARARRSIGRVDAAQAEVEDVLARAAVLDWSPLAAEARLARGEGLQQLGRYDDAAADLERALFDAGAAGADGVAADAAIALVMVDGQRRARIEDGARWARLAQMLLERGGTDDALRSAQLIANRGNVSFVSGAYEEARSAHQRALELREGALGPDHPDVAASLSNLGTIHAELRAYDDALAVYLRALDIRERLLGSDHPEVGQTLGNIGTVHGARGAYDEALIAHSRALAILERAHGPSHPDLAPALDNLGLVHQANGEIAQAIAAHERAIAIGEAALGIEHPDVAISLNNLAAAQRAQGSMERALETYVRALALTEKAVGSEHPTVGTLCANIGDVLLARGDPEQAATSFDRAIAIYERALGSDHESVAHPLVGRARVLLARGAAAEALEILERAVTLRDRASPTDLAEVRYELGRALWQAGGDRERALVLVSQALDVYRAAGPGHAATAAELSAWLSRSSRTPRRRG